MNAIVAAGAQPVAPRAWRAQLRGLPDLWNADDIACNLLRAIALDRTPWRKPPDFRRDLRLETRVIFVNWTDHLPAASATIQLGEHLGRLAQPGWVVSLEGPLGSGKTTLAQGLAAGLGVGERLTSPTFVLESQYRGRLLLRHFDLYRLGEAPSEEELIEIGLAEALTDEGVCLIEWADRLTKGALPDCLRVRLAHAQTGRSVEIAAADAAYEPVVKELLRERIGH